MEIVAGYKNAAVRHAAEQCQNIAVPSMDHLFLPFPVRRQGFRIQKTAHHAFRKRGTGQHPAVGGKQQKKDAVGSFPVRFPVEFLVHRRDPFGKGDLPEFRDCRTLH